MMTYCDVVEPSGRVVMWLRILLFGLTFVVGSVIIVPLAVSIKVTELGVVCFVD